MKASKTVEVKLYLYEGWAKALAGFSMEVLEGESLPSELKGALIELSEALDEEGFKAPEAVQRLNP